ncbi:MAG: gliding motility-associated C-terminal domain-containing protein [Bacteroidales bacterium]|nr:gliding motility-associated C-terminal domain-containing protein [Bacteroidales bacterium]
MKRIISLVLLAFFVSVECLNAQNPTPYNGTPPTFNTFTANYVKCRYGSTWASCNSSNAIWKYNAAGSGYSWYSTTTSGTTNSATTGVLNNGTNFSHRIVTSATSGGGIINGRDACMCYQSGNNYVQEYVIPYGGWDGNINTAADAIDTVVQIGGPNSQGTKSQSIEYWFKPDTNNSVLLVMFSFAQEKACHQVWWNPFFYIEVLDQNYNLLDLGYYPDLNGSPMSNPNNGNYWPYSQFLIVPIPDCSSYPAIPYCRATPSTYDYYGTNVMNNVFQIHSCPYNQYHNSVPTSHSNIECEWFQYTPIAFNLTEQARNNETVIFRVKAYACESSYHWAYGYFAAKMIPGSIKVDACGDDEISLSVPYGFQPTSYIWYAGADSASASYKSDYEGLRDLTLSRTDGTRIYPYYRCEMLSMTGVPFQYEANIKFYDLTPRFTYEQIKENCEYKVQFTDNSEIMLRAPAATVGGAEDTIYQNTQYIQWFNIIPGAGGNDTVMFAENTVNPTFTYSNPGDYNVMITIWDNARTCSVDTTIQIHLDSLIGGTGVDTIFTCEENLPVIYDQASFGDLYTWNDSGTRTVIYQGGTWNGCDSIVTVTLTVQKPMAQIAVSADYCDNFSTTLSVVSNVDVETYQWNTEATTSSIEVVEPGDYSVTITDQGGCMAEAEVNIPACTPFVNLPSAITPSDYNGLNDVLNLPQKNLIQSIELSIFNRNGELVYHTTSKDFEWDGRVNGKLFVNTVYNYLLKVVDYNGYATMYRGSITVL